jgi:RNA polymerase sigma-70 factor, ECF subfamily
MSRKPAANAAPGHASELFPVVYDELRVLARRYLARERRQHTLQPTALVHEAWLKLRNERRVDWNGRTHVLAIGAQAMRRLLIDYGRGRKRVKRGGGDVPSTLHDWLEAAQEQPVPVEEVLTLNDLLTRLSELDPRQAAIVEMRFFGGLSVPEVAEVLGLSARTVAGEWSHARAWLRQQLDVHAP